MSREGAVVHQTDPKLRVLHFVLSREEVLVCYMIDSFNQEVSWNAVRALYNSIKGHAKKAELPDIRKRAQASLTTRFPLRVNDV
jgi:hypothetical protein